jgi:Tol biopolymer transport system component
MSTHKSLSLLIVLMLAAAACGPAGGAQVTPTSAPVQPASTPTGQAPSPTEVPAGVLPAPLYFISAEGQQIWRIERDGQTASQITNEPAEVRYFDVSPTDGAIVYVSSNDLLRIDAAGGGRAVLVDGIDLPPEEFTLRLNNEITHPRWSPDGAQISYGLNGVNIIPAGGGEPRVVIASDLSPELTGEQNHPQATFYFDGLWSPDGAHLLIQFGFWQEGGGYLIKSLADGASVDINSEEGITCCNPAWTPDSQAIYFSNDSVGMFLPGLSRVSLDGTVEALITAPDGFASTTFPLVSYARPLNDGRLYTFYGEGQVDPNNGMPPWPPMLVMTRSDPDGVTNRTSLRPEPVYPTEVLWSADASGAAIMTYTHDVTDQSGLIHGPLSWLDTAGSPAVALPADGFQLHWGQ